MASPAVICLQQLIAFPSSASKLKYQIITNTRVNIYKDKQFRTLLTGSRFSRYKF